MVECEDTAEPNISKAKRTLTNTEIIAQALVFLIAGSETTATTLGWITHNLVMNPDCQQKLIEEVDAALDKHVSLNYLKERKISLNEIVKAKKGHKLPNFIII
jgi:cytochrome P450